MSLVATCLFIMSFFNIDSYLKYQFASIQFNDGDYEEASQIYSSLDVYNDSESRLIKSRYLQGKKLFFEGEYSEAAKYFLLVGDYLDGQDLYRESRYLLGEQYRREGQFARAANQFASLAGYKDADLQLIASTYDHAKQNYQASEITKAKLGFQNIKHYKDASAYLKMISMIEGSRSEYLKMKNEYLAQKTGSPYSGLPMAEYLPAISMTRDEVRKTSWGEPQDIAKANGKYSVNELWSYPYGKYLFFEYGLVAVIQE